MKIRQLVVRRIRIRSPATCESSLQSVRISCDCEVSKVNFEKTFENGTYHFLIQVMKV